jgi:hypothetical protein
LARVAEMRSSLEEAKSASIILEPVATRKLRQEIKKVSLLVGRRALGA